MKSHKHLWDILLAILLIIMLSLLVWLIFDLRNLYKTGELRPTRGFYRNQIYKQTMNPLQIEGWMTFSYVNYIFGLPTNYLSENLGIQDGHYPDLGINQYVKMKDLNDTIFLTNVRESVLEYIKNTQ